LRAAAREQTATGMATLGCWLTQHDPDRLQPAAWTGAKQSGNTGRPAMTGAQHLARVGAGCGRAVAQVIVQRLRDCRCLESSSTSMWHLHFLRRPQSAQGCMCWESAPSGIESRGPHHLCWFRLGLAQPLELARRPRLSLRCSVGRAGCCALSATALPHLAPLAMVAPARQGERQSHIGSRNRAA